jgi:glycosyltransferase involved in cell wall biosynthesis
MQTILAVIHTPTFGGPHNQVQKLTEALRGCGWDTIVVLPDESGNAVERLTSANIKVIQLPLHRVRKSANPKHHIRFGMGFIKEINSLRTIIREHQINIVQVFGIQNPHGAIAAHYENIPVVWQFLGTYAPYWMRFFLTPLAVKFSDVAMTTGLGVARAHPGVAGLRDRWFSFFPPVDSNEFTPDPEIRKIARTILNVPERAILVGTVGNYCWVKGHETIVKTAAMMQSDYLDLRFRIIGTPIQSSLKYYEESVKSLSSRYGLYHNGYLQFVEPSTTIAKLLPSFDIFLLTSHAEGIPTVILEAMACGIPVISTDVGSINEVVDDRVTGYLISPSNHRAAAEAIINLIHNPAMRREMGKKARERVMEKFNLSVCAQIHRSAYDKAQSYHQSKR